MRSTVSGLFTLLSLTIGAAAVTAHTLSVSGAVTAMSDSDWEFVQRVARDVYGFTRFGPCVSTLLLVAAVVLAVDRRTAARRTGWLLVVVSATLAACVRVIDWAVVTAGVSPGAGVGPYVLYSVFAAAGSALVFASRYLPGSDRPGLPSFRAPSSQS